MAKSSLIRNFLSVAGVASTLVSAGMAQAACTQANLNGRWQVYVTTMDFAEGVYWTHCELTVMPKTGDLAPGSNCHDDEDAYSVTGHLVVIDKKLCRIGGFVTDPADPEIGTIDHATMAKDKKTFHFVGTTTEGASTTGLFHGTAVKN